MSGLAELQLALPEIFVAAMACVVLVADLFVTEERRGLTHTLALLTLLFAGIITLRMMMPAGESMLAFSDTFVRDRFGDIIKLFAYLVLIAVFVYAKFFLRAAGLFKGEFYSLSLFALLGVMIMASAGSLLTVYLGLELLALSSYALVALNRDSAAGSEAGMKFFILGSLASGILLYGMSLVYGATGTLALGEISAALAGGLGDNPLLAFGLAFLVVGIGFKLGAVPFHMWLPDVYQGAPAAVTLLISSLPKLGYLSLAIRILADGMGGLHADWQAMLAVLAALSMILGNVVAIAQSNIKRMLAYSTIAHVGYLLLGILAGTAAGYAAATFYTIVYTMMSAGAFAVLIALSGDGIEAENLEDFKGLSRRNPWYALMMLMIMFSLAGIPVFVGFFAKWQVIAAAIQAGHLGLGVLAVVTAVIGAFYYLRVVKLMYFDEPDNPEPVIVPTDFRAVLSVNGLAMLGLGIFSGGLIGLCVSAFA
ncbi:MAG: NADH-quinone oxidoreductase subunit NuoN [Wenzhouxiangellaceae bacterium]|nr:NADH-quinone oxidoreductase subunit NuoN [Wenzhouxiangellaceae bacterium]